MTNGRPRRVIGLMTRPSILGSLSIWQSSSKESCDVLSHARWLGQRADRRLDGSAHVAVAGSSLTTSSIPVRWRAGGRLDGHLQRRRGHRRRRALDRLGGLAGARRAVGEHPRPVHGPRPRRGRRVHGAGDQPAHPGLRHGRRDVPGGRRRWMPARSSSSWRAASRSTRSSGPASTSRACSPGASRPAGRARSSSRATTTSSTPAKYAADPDGHDRGARARPRATRSASGYGNIDIDSSTLVDLSQPTVDEQQRTNYSARPSCRRSSARTSRPA